MTRSLAAIVVLVATASVRAQAPSVEPPRIGQPADFSRVVGMFQIAARIEPAAVAVEEPLTLIVTISGQAEAPYAPKRDLLRLFPDDMQRDFFVEPAGEQARQGSWEFVYRLRPKHTRVQFVPGLKLVYFTPRQRRYQTAYSDAIPLTVKPRPEPVVDIKGLTVVQAPATFLELADESEAPRGPELHWSPFQELALLLGPPCLCFAGLWWRRRRRTARAPGTRRRREVEQVVISLQQSPQDAATTARLVGDYLRLVLALPAQEPTPRDIDSWLKRRGVRQQTRQQWRTFLQQCDASRFGPVAAAEGHAAQAIPLIHALEDEPCLAAR
jgi:hypothetical protein